jgi:hypothetical protein
MWLWYFDLCNEMQYKAIQTKKNMMEFLDQSSMSVILKCGTETSIASVDATAPGSRSYIEFLRMLSADSDLDTMSVSMSEDSRVNVLIGSVRDGLLDMSTLWNVLVS